jgi:hypothetical protein
MDFCGWTEMKFNSSKLLLILIYDCSSFKDEKFENHRPVDTPGMRDYSSKIKNVYGCVHCSQKFKITVCDLDTL